MIKSRIKETTSVGSYFQKKLILFILKDIGIFEQVMPKVLLKTPNIVKKLLG